MEKELETKYVKTTKIKRRFEHLDVLKCIALLLIILAHVNADDEWIVQVRSFDVILMVYISGILSISSYSQTKGGLSYIGKRILRLYVPTVLCITLFYLFMFLFGETFLNEEMCKYLFLPDTVMASYLLLDGIGYIWIIRIYLMCAVIVPFIFFLLGKIGEIYTLGLGLLLCIVFSLSSNISTINENPLWIWGVSYMVPYGMVILVAILLRDRSMKTKIVVGVINLLITVGCVYYRYWNQQSVLISDNKYPPGIYYLTYGLGISILLENGFKNVKWNKDSNIISIMIWVSKNSMWLYLFHIFFVYFYNEVFRECHYVIRWVLIIASATVMTYFKNILIRDKKLGVWEKILKG